MGGEVIEVLQIYLELERMGFEVHQITHERVRNEIDKNYPNMEVKYVKDDLIQKVAMDELLQNGMLAEKMSKKKEGGAAISLGYRYS